MNAEMPKAWREDRDICNDHVNLAHTSKKFAWENARDSYDRLFNFRRSVAFTLSHSFLLALGRRPIFGRVLKNCFSY